MARVFLGLGSNVGDSNGTLRSAFAEISKVLQDARLSSLWGTSAMYVEDQPDFVNAAAVGDTLLPPASLLASIHEIEAAFGRNRGAERVKGPRTLDIDILLYGKTVLREDGLILPHPGLCDRRFALVPMLELDPSLVDPISGRPYSAILEALPPQGIYLLH